MSVSCLVIPFYMVIFIFMHACCPLIFVSFFLILFHDCCQFNCVVLLLCLLFCFTVFVILSHSLYLLQINCSMQLKWHFYFPLSFLLYHFFHPQPALCCISLVFDLFCQFSVISFITYLYLDYFVVLVSLQPALGTLWPTLVIGPYSSTN